MRSGDIRARRLDALGLFLAPLGWGQAGPEGGAGLQVAGVVGLLLLARLGGGWEQAEVVPVGLQGEGEGLPDWLGDVAVAGRGRHAAPGMQQREKSQAVVLPQQEMNLLLRLVMTPVVFPSTVGRTATGPFTT